MLYIITCRQEILIIFVKTYKWIREHAHYDDEHPKFALEIIKHYAITERMQRQVMFSAKRSLELLYLALHTSSNISPRMLNS